MLDTTENNSETIWINRQFTNAFLKSDITMADFMVLFAIAADSTYEQTQQDIADDLKVSRQQVCKSIKKLKNLGFLLEDEGSRKGVPNPEYFLS